MRPNEYFLISIPYAMKTLLSLSSLVLFGLMPTLAKATIDPTGSVSPAAVVNGSTVSFTRSGTCSNGFDWSEATLWQLSGYVVLGNIYTNPYTQTITALDLDQGTGVYSIQYRLVDDTYAYVDQWLTIGTTGAYYSNSSMSYIELSGNAYITEGSSTSTTVVIGDSSSNYESETYVNFGGTAVLGTDYTAYYNALGARSPVNTEVTEATTSMWSEISFDATGGYYSFSSNPITITPLNNSSFGTASKTIIVTRSNLTGIMIMLEPATGND